MTDVRHYWEGALLGGGHYWGGGGHYYVIILLSLTLSARTCSGHMLQDDGVNMHTSTYIHYL